MRNIGKYILSFLVLFVLILSTSLIAAFGVDANVTVTKEGLNASVNNKDNNVDNVAQPQVQEKVWLSINNMLGAKVRLLQLYSSILDKISEGDAVLEAINDIKPDYNASSLDEILLKLSALAHQINESIYNLDTEKDSKDYATDFLLFLNESKSLIREFSQKLHKDFSSEDLFQIRQRVREIRSDKYKELKEQIRDQIKKYIIQYNKMRLKEIFGENLSISEQDLIHKTHLRRKLKLMIRNTLMKQLKQDKALVLRSALNNTEGNTTHKNISLRESRMRILFLRKQIKKRLQEIKSENIKERLEVLNRIKEKKEILRNRIKQKILNRLHKHRTLVNESNDQREHVFVKHIWNNKRKILPINKTLVR